MKVGGYALIEVPNYGCNVLNHDYGLWEEHVNYFTLDTLRYFLALAGIEIIHEEIILFSGEGIFVIGKKSPNVTCSLEYLPELCKQNAKYAALWPEFRQKFSQYLSSEKQAGKRIAVYGAGSRAFSLINFSNVAGEIEFVVDDQLEKQNYFMPGGKLPILPSEALYKERIDVCLLAVNTENEEKVLKRHLAWVENGGRFWSILPPSNLMAPFWPRP